MVEITGDRQRSVSESTNSRLNVSDEQQNLNSSVETKEIKQSIADNGDQSTVTFESEGLCVGIVVTKFALKFKQYIDLGFGGPFIYGTSPLGQTVEEFNAAAAAKKQGPFLGTMDASPNMLFVDGVIEQETRTICREPQTFSCDGTSTFDRTSRRAYEVVENTSRNNTDLPEFITTKIVERPFNKRQNAGEGFGPLTYLANKFYHGLPPFSPTENIPETQQTLYRIRAGVEPVANRSAFSEKDMELLDELFSYREGTINFEQEEFKILGCCDYPCPSKFKNKDMSISFQRSYKDKDARGVIVPSTGSRGMEGGSTYSGGEPYTTVGRPGFGGDDTEKFAGVDIFNDKFLMDFKDGLVKQFGLEGKTKNPEFEKCCKRGPITGPRNTPSPITFPISPGSEQEGDNFCLGILDFLAKLTFGDTSTENGAIPCTIEVEVLGHAGCLGLNCEGLTWYFEGMIPHFDSPSRYLERHNNNQIHRNSFGELEYYAGLNFAGTGQGPITGEKLKLAQERIRAENRNQEKLFRSMGFTEERVNELIASLPARLNDPVVLEFYNDWPDDGKVDGRGWLDLGCCDCEEPLDPYESDIINIANPKTSTSFSLEEGQEGEFKANGAAQFPGEVSGVSPPPGPGQTPGPCTSKFQKFIQFTVDVPISLLNVGGTRLPDGTIVPEADASLDTDAMHRFAIDAAGNEAVSVIDQAIRSGEFKCPDNSNQ